MIRTALAVAALVCTAASGADAEDRGAFVDEVEVFGGIDRDAARDLVVAALARVGLRAHFADPGAPPCGDQPACLADRAQTGGFAVAVRVTIAAVADEVVAAVLVVRAGRVPAHRQVAQAVSLDALDEELGAALAAAPGVVPEPERPRRRAAWVALGGAVLLGSGGALALWKAYDLRAEFLSNHVDDNGDVVGISPAGARAAEDRAQRWALAGDLLLAGAAAAGITATVLFVRGGDGEVRPAGIAVGGRF